MEDIRFVPNRHGTILTLNEHRKRLLYIINIVCLITFIPFSAMAYLHGFFGLGLCLLAFAILLCVNTISVFIRGSEYFHYSIVVFFLFAALTLGVYHRGVAAVFWVFPVISTSLFVLPITAALIFSTLLTVAVTSVLLIQMTADVALRASASMVISIGISWVLVNLIQGLQEQLRKISEEDPLTGLSNRRQLDGKIDEALEKYRLEGVSSIVLLIDIDKFKTINDTYGHDVGDSIIKMVAQAIKQSIRKSDISFRLGGDEFLVLLNGIDWQQGSLVTEKIRSAIATMSEPEEFNVSVSIGASAINDGMDKDSWIKQADISMYQAKTNGRDAAVFN